MTIGESPNKKKIVSLDLTRKVNLLRLWRGESFHQKSLVLEKKSGLTKTLTPLIKHYLLSIEIWNNSDFMKIKLEYLLLVYEWILMSQSIKSKTTVQREGITTLRIYQYWIFHHTVIETCFEMLKPSEHKKSWRYSSYKSPNFLFC